MMNVNRNRRARFARRGFSLIELLLVLVILSVLAAIVLPKFTGKSQDARIAAAKADIQAFETALTAFEIACGRYPAEDEGLDALMEEPNDAPNWDGPYLTRNVVPKDPWGNPYVYVCPGRINTKGYDVYSAGPNGNEGDDDDIGNWIAEN